MIDHQVFDHEPVWEACSHRLAAPWFGGGHLFGRAAPGEGAVSVARRTGVGVFAGALPTLSLAAFLAAGRTRALVFDPDPARRERLWEALGPERERVLLLEDERPGGAPLDEVLPAGFFEGGWPAAFCLPGEPDDGLAARSAEAAELAFYRRRILPLTVQGAWASLPMRPMRRGRFFDEEKHLYANLPALAACSGIDALAGRFAGADAVIVAAGPERYAHMDLVRKAKGRAVIVSINHVAEELARAGAAPDFVVVSDPSLEAEDSLRRVRGLGGTVLAAHPTAYAGAGFGRTLFWGDPGGRARNLARWSGLPMHVSVTTAAWSLARRLGCARMILVGVQFGSPGRGKDAAGAVRGLRGEPMEAPLHYRDAARWLVERIGTSRAAAVNTSSASLVHGPNIGFDPAPELGRSDVAGTMAGILAGPSRPLASKKAVAEYAHEKRRFWRMVLGRAQDALAGRADPGAVLGVLDELGVGYLVQRLPGYDNRRIQARLFGRVSPPARQAALGEHFRAVVSLSRVLLALLERSLSRLA